MEWQQTIANELVISGQGLHSGAKIEMKILPQSENTGILFGRADLPGQPVVKASVEAVIDTKRSTTIGRDHWQIATIEHLMAVFHGLEVDNALVLVDGAEIPLGDGSCQYFAEEIMKIGLVRQSAPRIRLQLSQPVWVEGSVQCQNKAAPALLTILPSDKLEIFFTFTSDHPVTGTQFFHFLASPENFLTEIAPARTIAFLKEIEYLRSQGLALGGDLETVVVVGEQGYENQLRFSEEIVRHKILDILGDLYLLGPLTGKIIAIRSGHSLDFALAKEILASFKENLKEE